MVLLVDHDDVVDPAQRAVARDACRGRTRPPARRRARPSRASAILPFMAPPLSNWGEGFHLAPVYVRRALGSATDDATRPSTSASGPACAPPSARRSCSRAAAGPRARRGSPPAATSSGATSRTTGCCAGTSRRARSGCSGQPAGNTNGHTVDPQGRLVSCEHGSRRVTRTEHDGSITVIADSYEGKRLNSPNDVVVRSDGSVWFTDPSYGIESDYEGNRADPRARRLLRLPRRPARRRVPDRRRRLRPPERAGVLARRAPALRLRYRRRAVAHPLVRGRPTTARCPAARCSPSATAARSTASASTRPAGSGRARETASTASIRTARCSARCASPRSSPTSSSAGRSATGCSCARRRRCTRCT